MSSLEDLKQALRGPRRQLALSYDRKVWFTMPPKGYYGPKRRRRRRRAKR